MSTSGAPESHELQLHSLHKRSLDSIPVNFWTRCFATNLPIEDSPRDALRLRIDINTLREESFELTRENVLIFVNKAKDLTLETANSLFGESSSGQRIF